MAYILALDQGTTSSRAILFDEAGAIVAVAQHEFQQFYPQAGWVEHDPTEILTSQLACAVEALGKAGARPRDVAAIGITNQRETVIVWERATGKPIHPAIVWQDRRTAAQCAALEESGLGERCLRRPGWCWIRISRRPRCVDSGQRCRARGRGPSAASWRFGTVDSWLIWHLTSGARHVTDVTNASRTLLYNIVKGEWDAELLRIFGDSREHAAGGGVVEREGGRGDHDAGAGRRGDCGHCRRPAGGAVWAVVLEAGRGEEHLRDRLLSAAEHRGRSLCGRSTG